MKTIKKLTLKHLAPYLPYDLKCRIGQWQTERRPQKGRATAAGEWPSLLPGF